MATVKNVPGAPSGNPYIDTLVWGGWTWNEAVPIKAWFGDSWELDAALAGSSRNGFEGYFAADPQTGQRIVDPNSVTNWDWVDLTAVNAFRYAISLYESVCGLKFDRGEYTLEQSDIVWWGFHDDENPALGIHENQESVPNNVEQVWGYFNFGGSTWNQLRFGGDGLNTIIHEIGHGLGLAHPHDGGSRADATTFPGVEGGASDTGNLGLNQSVWTVMSYNRGWNGAPSSEVYGGQGGLGAFDIATLQFLYGVNTTTARGNDTYKLPTRNAAGTGWMCIWDAAGVDTISGLSATGSVTIDLRAATLAANDPNAGGFISAQARIGGGFTIAKNVTIENATGGSYADRLYGNTAANLLRGNGGTDTLNGASGSDKLYGGSGSDVLYGGSGTGRDVFVFDKAPNSRSNKDRILDWNKTYDTIHLENAVFKALKKTGTLSKSSFKLGAAAADSNDFVGYNKATGDLWYDANGSKAGGQAVFANIGKNKAIAYNDLVVI